MANFYWMAATSQTWNSVSTSNKWSNTSGGALITTTGPTAADDVFFDANSPANCVVGSGTYACRSINFTGFTRTFNHTVGTLNVGNGVAAGSVDVLKFVSGMTYTKGGTFNLIATHNTQQTITSAGKTIQVLNINGAGSNYVLGDALSLTNAFVITTGTFSTGSNYAMTLSGGFNSSNTNARTINFNSSTVTIGMSGTFWTMTTTTGLTNPTTAFSSCTLASISNAHVTASFYGGGLTYGSITPGLNFGGTGFFIYGNNTIYSLVFSSGSIGTFFEAGSTTTFTNNFSIVNSGPSLISLQSLTSGSTFTIKGSFQTFSGNYLDVKDCIGAGETKWFAANSTNSGNNTNWRFNAPNQGTQSLLGCGI